MPDLEHLHAIVSGHVQGVSFRYYTAETARRLGLTGWVRNCPDRTVEVHAEGTREQLNLLVAFLRQGPPAARVTGVNTNWHPATGGMTTFQIRQDRVDKVS